MKQMMSLRMSTRAGSPRVELVVEQRPVPRTVEVVVAVKAAGISPEGLADSGDLDRQERPAFALEFAGLVAEVGLGVSDFHLGDSVFGTIPPDHSGAACTYLAVPVTHLAKMPTWLSFAQGATLPIAGLSSWQALVEEAHVRPGERVLVLEGANPNGSFCVQLAVLLGCRVAATAATSDTEFIRNLGAEPLVGPIGVDSASDFDVVINAGPIEQWELASALVKPDGHVVTLCAPPERRQLPASGAIVSTVAPHSGRADLEMLARLVAAGALSVDIANEVALERVPALVSGDRSAVPQHGRTVIYVR